MRVIVSAVAPLAMAACASREPSYVRGPGPTATTEDAALSQTLIASPPAQAVPPSRCAQRIGTYFQSIAERRGGTCGRVEDDAIFVAEQPLVAAPCIGAIEYSPDNCDVTYRQECPTGSGNTLLVAGKMHWTADGSAGAGHEERSVRTGDAAPFCVSTYETTASRMSRDRHPLATNRSARAYAEADTTELFVPRPSTPPPSSLSSVSDPRVSPATSAPETSVTSTATGTPSSGNGLGPTLCSDGSMSPSAGSGTCSHHGGESGKPHRPHRPSRR